VLSDALLKSELFSNMSKLWFCEYDWTFNFLNSSSIFKNQTSHFGNESLALFESDKMISENKQQENLKDQVLLTIGNASSC